MAQHTRIRKERDFMLSLHSWRFLSVFFIVIAVCYAVGWGILVWNENRITVLRADTVVPADASDYWVNLDKVEWKKDDIAITDDFVQISGWIVKPGQQVDKVEIRIVLKDTSTGECYVFPTDVTERPDVTEFFHDGTLYDECGFSVRVPYWEELDHTDYEILAQYDLNNDSRVYVPFHTTIKKSAKEQEHAE